MSERVFTGTVVKKDGCRISFLIDRVWKGPAVKESELNLYCGEIHSIYPFVEGESYLVFLGRMGPQQHDSAGWPFVSPCSATRKLAEAQDAIRELGRATRPH
jgi:hypothetical protein